MPVFALLSGYALVVYLCLAVLAVVKNPRGRVNWTLAGLLLALAVWSFEDVFHGDPHLIPERVQFFSDLGTVGRCSFASLFLIFVLVYTRQSRRLRSWPVILSLAAVPALFCYVLWSRLIVPVNQRFSFGWTVTWPSTFWSLLFYGSYLFLMAVSFRLLARYRVRAVLPQERTQATIVLVSSLVALVLGTITDVVLPMTTVRFPELASSFALIMAGGIYTAITRYGMASIAAAAAPQEILRTMADAMLLVDPAGRLISFNAATREMLGYSRVELTGGPATALFARPDEFDGLQARLAVEEMIPRAEIAGRMRDGREVPLSASGRLMHDPTGEAVGSVWILRNVADLKRAEARVQRLATDLRILNVLAVELAAAPSEADTFRILAERMRTLADARAVSLSEYDRATRELKMRVFDAEPEILTALNELMGRDVRGLHFPVAAETAKMLRTEPVLRLASLSEATFGAIPAEIADTLQHALGIESLVGLALFDEDDLLGTAVVAYSKGGEPLTDDILRTYANIAAVYLRRRRIEAALRESEDKYRNLVERASDGIVIIQDALVKYCNPRIAEMNGTSVAEVLGTRFEDHIHADQLPQLVERYRRRLAGEAVPATYETILRTVHGDPVPVEINAGIISYQGRPADMIIVRDISERKQAELALRRERDQAENYLNVAGVLIVALDRQGMVTRLNRRGAEILGFREDELRGRDWFANCLPTRTRERARSNFDSLMAGATGLAEYFEGRIVSRAGTERLIAWHNALLRDDAGRPAGTLSSGEDITDREQALAALRESEERYRFLFESAPIGITVSDRNARILEVNNQMCEMTGYARDELLTMRSPQLHPSESDSAPIRAELERTGRVANREVVIGRKDGTRFTALLNVQPGELGGQQVYFRTLRDITERKRAEEKLRSYTQRLELLHEFDKAILGARSAERIAESVLIQTRKLTGCERASITLFDQASGTARVIALDVSTATRVGAGKEIALSDMPLAELARGNTVRVEDIAAMANPTPTHRALLAEGVRSIMNVPLVVQGELLGALNLGSERVFGFGSDEEEVANQLAAQISIALHQARLEEELRRRASELEDRVAERTAQLEAANRELEAFSYSVSHDLRAPLRSLDGFSQALLEDYAGALDAAAQEHLRRIRGASQRMARLIDDLLQLSHVTRGELQRERVDMSRMADEVMTEIRAAEPGRAVEFRTAPGLAGRADPRLIRIVLVNLLGNAWKFTAGKADARIEFGGRPPGRESRLTETLFVRDNGAGFDMNYAGKLGAPFQRLHTESEFPGSGIGLATAQRIIQRHGGRIWWESVPGQGATFYFTLPERPVERGGRDPAGGGTQR
jgi:PAS domain S-box-containing protein